MWKVFIKALQSVTGITKCNSTNIHHKYMVLKLVQIHLLIKWRNFQVQRNFIVYFFFFILDVNDVLTDNK